MIKLILEDKRGNIVRLLGYDSVEADMFHEMSPKYSFFLARMHKANYEDSLVAAFDGLQANEWAWTYTGDISEWLQKYPNEFRKVKNMELREFVKHRVEHEYLMKELEKRENIKKDALMTFDDGFFWHDTKSSECDDWIGKKMQNCGMDPLGVIHVLFDKDFEPHGMLTYYARDNSILQALGKQNDIPDEKYWKYFKEYIASMPGFVDVDIMPPNHNAHNLHPDNPEYIQLMELEAWQVELEPRRRKEQEPQLRENININIPPRGLNEELWEDKKLKPDVAEALLKIADTFLEFLKIQVSVEDIIITGSMANFNWTKYSDIDLHILIDYKLVDENDLEFVREFFNSKRSVWNNKHSIHVKGYEVEVYPQDSEEEHISSGIYSVKQGRWLIEPEKKENENIKAEGVVHKAIDYQNAIDNAKDYDDLARLVDKIWKMRKSGLEDEGEFSHENLVFKYLRNSGYLDKLMQWRNQKQDQELSLTEQQLNEDQRGNIVNILKLPRFIADYYNNLSPKYAYMFARWWKEEYADGSTRPGSSGWWGQTRINVVKHLIQKMGDGLSVLRAGEVSVDEKSIITIGKLDYLETSNAREISSALSGPNGRNIFKQIKNMSLEDAKKFVEEKRKKDLRTDKDNIVMSFPDGYFWYDTQSAVCPEWMKDQMQHCGRDLRGHMIFLVGPENDLHGTLTWDKENSTVVQAVGKQNEMPERKYWKYFSEFVNQQKAPPSQDLFMLSLEKLGNWLWDQMPKEMKVPIVTTDATGLTTYKVRGMLHNERGPAMVDIFHPSFRDATIEDDSDAAIFVRRIAGSKYYEQYYLDGVRLEKDVWEKEVAKLDKHGLRIHN